MTSRTHQPNSTNQRIFRNIRTTELACSQWTSELIPGGDLGEKGPSQAPVFGHQLVMLFRGVMGALLENMNSWGRVLCVYSPAPLSVPLPVCGWTCNKPDSFSCCRASLDCSHVLPAMVDSIPLEWKMKLTSFSSDCVQLWYFISAMGRSLT